MTDLNEWLEAQRGSMKLSEFYEKYWKITMPNGDVVHPKLTKRERLILDKAEELSVPPYIRALRRREGWSLEVHPDVKNAINNQPKNKQT